MVWQPNQLHCLPNVGGHGPLTGSAVFQCSHMTRVHGCYGIGLK